MYAYTLIDSNKFNIDYKESNIKNALEKFKESLTSEKYPKAKDKDECKASFFNFCCRR